MQVFVTPKAEKNFDMIVDYLTREWGKQTAQQFIQKTDDILSILKNYPLLGQVEKDSIRGLHLSKQTRILYRIHNNKIIILSFFDVRQDPDKKFS